MQFFLNKMDKLLLIALFCIFWLPSDDSTEVETNKPWITVFAPQKIRPNRSFSIAITNAFNHSIEFSVSLTGRTMEDSIDVMVNHQTSELVSFEIGDVIRPYYEDYQLTVVATNRADWFSEEIVVSVATKTMSILIHTDKPVYKPGDVLRFRIVLFDIDMMPVTSIDTIVVVIIGSDDNTVREWERAKLQNGIFESGILIASSALLGNWTLMVKANDRIEHMETKRIEVSEYVLPKLSVAVYPSRALSMRDNTVLLSIESFNRLGFPVTGTAVVDLYVGASRFKPDFSKAVSISGKTQIRFDYIQFDEYFDLDDEDEDVEKITEISAYVSITETFSNYTVSKWQLISIYRYPFKVSLIRSTPGFSPGHPYDAKIAIQDYNGKSFCCLDKPLTLRVEYDGEESERHYEVFRLDDNGIANLKFYPPDGTMEMTVTAIYGSGDEYVLATNYAQNDYITIKSKQNNRFQVNKLVTFSVECSEHMDLLTYFFMARDNIISVESVNVKSRKKYQLQKIKLTAEMVPFSTLFVYYVTKGGTLVHDSYEIAFETFNNDFKVRLDKNEYRPGSDMFIETTAASDSNLFLYAIDRSVIQFGRNGHELFRQDILDEYRKMIGNVENKHNAIATTGLVVRTTAEQQYDTTNRFKRNLRCAKIGELQTRTHFPEAWLWINFPMNDWSYRTGIHSVPDTITSWHVAGYALSPTQGLGIVTQPQTMVVKKPFYITVDLPYSIKRFEVSTIQVMVFNFLDTGTESNVTLHSTNNEFDFADDFSTNGTFRQNEVFVPSNNGKPTSFLIRANTIGEISINITAKNYLANDSVKYMLRVVPENVFQERIIDRFIQNSEHSNYSYNFTLNIPRFVEEGSVYIEFSLDPKIVDITSVHLEDIRRLLQGGGEQNMNKFVLSVAILELHSSFHGFTPVVTIDNIKNMVATAYQNQMKYKHYNGGFRDIQGSSSKPSTFVTAQVAMSLIVAAKYVSIDKGVTDRAFEWLASLQKSDGSFDEVGDVYYQAIQEGRNTSEISLTAFVLTAFLESEDIKNKHQTVINKATNYLVYNFYNIENTYDLAVATYALSMQHHTKSVDFLDKLFEASQLNNFGDRFWIAGELSVEITAYGLLSCLAQHKNSDAIALVRWLNRQRQASGAFSITQATFVELKALTKAMERMSYRYNDYYVKMICLKYQYQSYTIDRRGSEMALIIDKHQFGKVSRVLPSSARVLSFAITGKGFGVLQVYYKYAMSVLNYRKQKFKIDATANNSTSTIHKYDLRVCIAYRPEEWGGVVDKTMVEVFFPSGFVADIEDVRDLSGSIMNIENRFGNTSLSINYKSLGEKEQCFQVTAYRRNKIAFHRPAYITVYNVRNRQEFGIQEYAGPQMRACDICEDEDCKILGCPY